MELFYADPEHIRDDLAVLDDFERKHIVQTLRKKEGEIIHLTDGQGTHYTGAILSLKPHLSVQIMKKERIPAARVPLALACGFIKPNRLDFVLEKGTELGVNHFVLFKSDYANYFSANENRYRKIIRQAVKQSLHFYFPTLTFLKSFNALLAYSEKFSVKLAAIDQSYPALREMIGPIQKAQQLLIVIGPEGGFSADEVSGLLNNGFNGVSLASNRLRTETAALTAVSFVKQYI
ncbi:RsmE family RNA methyltransferase [Caldithrix abyssi]|uniref:Ribosomal RNA small subunit methyltransferase E n=1 Tax=Caldithrix abyssi DSM 13497 TaxID=880073 RepID=H1XPK4_CALAY|nr:RsmE family RNA methyltransferase [Caldithrix abyssi]APF19829.1 16S rRNA (uracil1498-N3)-methyltransferase [Caldithrix abyssi DSM 13497]EHO39925.1 Ribosomal RNA small subunit methyltransferase E [Caldithrix abyssi DSM 13497]